MGVGTTRKFGETVFNDLENVALLHSRRMIP
nr:MAG TPA: hypothetical protein [Caudoviricetes sp.]